MARKPKALGGGEAAFDPKGAWTGNICAGLRLARLRYIAAREELARQIETRTELDRAMDSGDLRPNSPKYEAACKRLVGALRKIRELRATIASLGSAYGRIIEAADGGKLAAGMSPEDVVELGTTEPDDEQLAFGGDGEGGEGEPGDKREE